MLSQLVTGMAFDTAVVGSLPLLVFPGVSVEDVRELILEKSMVNARVPVSLSVVSGSLSLLEHDENKPMASRALKAIEKTLFFMLKIVKKVW